VKWKSAAARRLREMAGGVSVELAVPTVIGQLLSGISCPPTDLDALGARLNVAGIDDDEQTPVVGELRRDKGAFRIVCAAGQSPVRRRFTIAHELAHVVFESSGPRAPRVGDDLEKLCDMLSAEILMPRTVFEYALGERPVDATTIRALASRFQTSLTATAIRCADLRPVSVLDVQDGRVRWTRGPVRPTRYQLDQLMGQAFDGEPGDGLVFVERAGRGHVYTSEWVRVSGRKSGLLVLIPRSNPAA
jgi:hypothetical protein